MKCLALFFFISVIFLVVNLIVFLTGNATSLTYFSLGLHFGATLLSGIVLHTNGYPFQVISLNFIVKGEH